MTKYNIGIEDDVSGTSLPYGDPIRVTPVDQRQFIFWGLGGDGTVGANKAAIKTMALETDMEAQG